MVCLGGDGFMLETLHETMSFNVPVYGMNCGSVGFLMNTFDEDNLPERLAQTQAAILHPLRMHAVTRSGVVEEALALNDVFLFRQTRQAGKIRITVDGKVRLPELICDGVLVSTPARIDRLQPVRARSDRAALGQSPAAHADQRVPPAQVGAGALLPSTVDVGFEVLEPDKRPVAGGRGLHGSPRRGLGRCQRGSLGPDRPVVRSGPQPLRADHRRAVHRLNGAPAAVIRRR